MNIYGKAVVVLVVGWVAFGVWVAVTHKTPPRLATHEELCQVWLKSVHTDQEAADWEVQCSPEETE